MNTSKNSTVKDMALAALFIAIGYFLPFITGQIPAIGRMLLPMHIPVILCGLICGWKWGLLTGIILPLLRSLTLGMPVFYPMAIAMAFELATYGAVAGYLYSKSKWKCVFAVFRSLIAAMIAGRVVYGIAMILLLGVQGQSYSWPVFLSSAIIEGIPGIVLQLILIPLVMAALNKAGVVTFSKKPQEETC